MVQPWTTTITNDILDGRVMSYWLVVWPHWRVWLYTSLLSSKLPLKGNEPMIYLHNEPTIANNEPVHWRVMNQWYLKLDNLANQSDQC